MIKRITDRPMPLFVFWTAVSLLYCLTVVTIEFHSVPVPDLHSFALAFLQWLTVSVCASGVMMVLCSSRILFAVCFPLLAVVSATMAYFHLTLGVNLTGDWIETTMSGSGMMGMLSAPLVAIIAAVGLLSAMIALFRWTRVRASARTAVTALTVGVAITCLPGFILPGIWAPVAARLPYSIYSATAEYLSNLKRINDGRDTYVNTPATASATPPDVIFVVGESLRADHLPQNGYARNTMPLLSRDTALIVFPDIYSEFNITFASVPHLLTRLNLTSDEASFHDQSFITLFKNAGYTTAWFANQSPTETFAYYAHECDSLIRCKGNAAKSMYSYGKWLDADLLPLISSWLGNSGKPKLAVVHTIGSHWWYNSHYTDRHARFRPDMTNKEFATLTHEQIVNSYDNSIVATDEFLAGLFSLLRGRNAVVLYCADHGEGMGENGNYLHATTNDVTHNPACMIWYSPEYARLFPDKVAAARRGKDQRHTTEAIFHTALDLGALETPALDRSKSLLKK